jgi:D-alanyl-D-alanine carboxypeptidase
LKQVIITFVLVFCLVVFGAAAAYAFDVEAASSILIDADSGRVLFEQDAHDSLPVASLTKILTALVTLEHFDNLRQTYTLPADFPNVEEITINLEAGETHTIEDLLYALMLNSANDAGLALALAVGGSEDNFAQMMNQRCLDIGLKESNWVGPHGLDDDALSSAYDMAYITREAMRIPRFNNFINTLTHTMPWAGHENDRVLTSHNRLLTRYEGADGVKTGFTTKAGNCLVGSATRNGLRLIGVVLKCEDTYGQMAELLDYGFANYELRQAAAVGDVAASIPVIKGRADSINAVFGSNVRLLTLKEEGYLQAPELLLPESLTTPIDSRTPLGEAVFHDGAGNFKRVELFPASDMERFTLRDIVREALMRIMRVLIE